MIYAYERDSSLLSLKSTVVAIGTDRDRPFAILADTIFYPEGGGQPSDRGTINGVAVTALLERDGQVVHFLESPIEPGPCELNLDAAHRLAMMQHHSGQHLLSAVAQDRFGWATTAFHLSDHSADIELDAARISIADLRRLEEAVAEQIRGARQISTSYVTVEQYRALPVRSRGLPAGHTGDVRLVEIDGADLSSCGGTHLRSSAEIELVALLGTEPMRGGTRLYFACGARARRRLAAHEERNLELRRLLGASDDELIGAVSQRIEALKEGTKREKKLLAALAENEARMLLASSAERLSGWWPDRDQAFLQELSRQLFQRAPDRLLLLAAGPIGAGSFLLAAGPGCAVALRPLAASILRAIGGKGGGSERAIQGRAERVDLVPRCWVRCREIES